MTVNSLFNGLIGNAFYGGIATLIIIAAMFWKANKVSSTGSKAKMISWSIASSIMVIVAVMTHAIAVSIIWPKIQSAFTSMPAQNLINTGNALTSSIDNILWSNGSGEMQAAPMGPNAFKAPMQEASTSPVQPNSAPQIVTNAQAVDAVLALGATATPDAQQQIDSFVAAAKTGDSYTVAGGDSLGRIAKQFGISAAELCNANRAIIKDCNVIRSGWQLVIPAPGQPVAGQPVTTIPQSFGQQAPASAAKPTPVIVQAAPLQRSQDGQVIISNNAQAVQAIQALAAPVVAAAIPTPQPAYVLREVLANANKPAGGGQAYIDQFLKTQTDTAIASK